MIFKIKYQHSKFDFTELMGWQEGGRGGGGGYGHILAFLGGVWTHLSILGGGSGLCRL